MAGPIDATPAPKSATGERGFRLLGLPSWLLLIAVVLPLATGARTLFYRDVLNTHYPLKAAQARLMDGGQWQWPAPLVDPYRGGGQPLLGNPNAVPFYPTNVLFRVADPLWALNAHFWLHWLLAPFAGFWLGRSWRLGRPGAWACGVAWATGGYVMSLLNLYNMVALAVLAPATVAAFARLGRSRRRQDLAAATVCVGLTFLGGDPASAAIVYLLATMAFLTAAGRPAPALRRAARRALPAFGLGLLLATPVLVAMLRVLPSSYRGLWRYDAGSVLAQSWHPSTLLDWLIPGFFGEVDLTFWGTALFGGNPPFFPSLSPGWIVLALAAAAGFRRNGRMLWAWGSVAGGVLVSLGAHNPPLARLAEWTDVGLLRYPVKAWVAVALGLSLLAGLGFERLWRGLRGKATAGAVLLGAMAGTLLAHTQIQPGSRLVRWAVELSNGRLAGAALEAELARWDRVSAVAPLIFVAAVVCVLFARHRIMALALLLLIQAASQVGLLIDLVATDDAALYRAKSPVVAELRTGGDEDVDVVHGAFDGQFGHHLDQKPGPPADSSLRALGRSLFAESFHGAGIAGGLRYPFVRSPEGLDSFYAVAFAKALPGLDDPGRLRVLEAAGVEYLLLNRPLVVPDAARRVALTTTARTAEDRSLFIYRLRLGADEVSLVGGVRRAGSMTEARDMLVDPWFDPRREVILPGDGPGRRAEAADLRVDVVRDEPQDLAVVAIGDAPSHLVVQRAWLPIWRAMVDGEPAQVRIANGWQMAVAVPPGRHEVRLFTGRRPGWWALGVFVLALGLVCWLALAPVSRSVAQPRGE